MDTSKTGGGDDLPPGWYMGMDPNYQRPFYYNKRTRRSTWTRPAGEEGVAAANLARSDGSYSQVANSSAQAQSPRENGGGAQSKWVEVYSPEHKRTYFFNRATKESSWNPPPEYAGTEKQQVGAASSNLGAPASVKEVPALREAWQEIQQARNELAKERELHMNQLRSEWQALQSQIAALRELTISTSTQEVPVAEPLGQPNGAKLFGDALHVPGAPSEPGSPGAPRKKKNAAKSNLAAGLLSELEDYAGSLMRRRESIHAMSEQVTDSEQASRSRTDSMVGREESRRILMEARKARQFHRDGDSDESDDDFDSEEYIKSVLGSSNAEGDAESPSKKNKKLYEKALIPTAHVLEEEIRNVNKGFNQINAEVEAIHQAKMMVDEFDFDDYYEFFGVTCEVTSSELKKAYYKLQKKYHPDKFEGDPALAAKRSAELAEAYNTLIDPWQRFVYDQQDGLKDFKTHMHVLQCFVNFIVSAVSIIHHPNKPPSYAPVVLTQTYVKYFQKKSLIWLSPDHKTFMIGRVHNLEPEPKDLKKFKVIPVEDVVDIVRGNQNEAFAVTGVASREERYFSIVMKDGQSYNLDALAHKEREYLCQRLTMLVIHLQQNKSWFLKHKASFLMRKRKKRRTKKKPSSKESSEQPDKPAEENNEDDEY